MCFHSQATVFVFSRLGHEVTRESQERWAVQWLIKYCTVVIRQVQIHCMYAWRNIAVFIVHPFYSSDQDLQIKEEFWRITTISLEQSFMYKLDHYTPKLTALMKAKGGVVGTRLRPHLDKLSQVCMMYLLQEDRSTVCHSFTHILPLS